MVLFITVVFGVCAWYGVFMHTCICVGCECMVCLCAEDDAQVQRKAHLEFKVGSR